MFWPYLTISGSFRSFFFLTSKIEVCLVTLGFFGQFLAIFDFFWQFLENFDYLQQTLESGQLPPQYGGEVDRDTTPYRDGGFEPPNEIGPPSMDFPCLGYPSSIVEYASPDYHKIKD